MGTDERLKSHRLLHGGVKLTPEASDTGPRRCVRSNWGSEEQLLEAETGMAAKRILVVDDLEAILAIVREFLEMEGFAVMTAKNGPEAVCIADRYDGDIDLLVTDVQMPGMNGLLLAESLRTSRPAIAVIIMSAVSLGPLDKNRARKLKALFLWKPFTSKELLLKVNELVLLR